MPDTLPGNLLEPVRSFIADQKWVFAKTYAATAPHEYIIRRKLPEDQREKFDAFVQAIREHGYEGTFGRAKYRYLDIDGWKYWSMYLPGEAGHGIINRDRLGGWDGHMPQ